MKKLLSLMLFLMAALMTTATFTSCGDDDDDNNTANVGGTYTGRDTLVFSYGPANFKQFNTTDVEYTISENKDGSINVVIPEETFDFNYAKMGNIEQGAFSVANIPYNATKKAYYLDYSGKANADVYVYGAKKNYTVTEGEITVTFNANKVTIVNKHKFGSMPMEMTGTFVGTRK